MSFDPFGEHIQADPPAPAASAPAGPGMPPIDDRYDRARDRTQWAAMFLIASSTINLLLALAQAGIFIVVVITPAATLHRFFVKQLEEVVNQPGVKGKQNPMAEAMKPTLEQALKTEPGKFKNQRMMQEGLVAGLLLAVAGLGVLGGMRMYQLKSYSLAMLGSLASAVPCLSPMTCCCGVGMMIGGWCVMLLLMPDVREVFQS